MLPAFLTFTDWGPVFAVLVLATLGIAWASDEHGLQKIALLLLFAWAATNVAVECLGFERAPLMLASIDAATATTIALIGYRARSRTALWVFRLYLLIAMWHVTAFVLHIQGSFTYYTMLGAIFFFQLLITGGASAWVALYTRPVPGRERSGDRAPSRSPMGRSS